MPDDLCVVAIDGGATSGWAVGTFTVADLDSPKDEYKVLKHWAAGVCGGDEHEMLDELVGLLEVWDDAAVVVERFHLRPGMPTMDDELLSPVRVNAVVDHYLWDEDRPVYFQNPGDAMSTFPDELLEKWQLWSPSVDARIATAHLLLFVRRLRLPKVGKVIRDQMGWPQS